MSDNESIRIGRNIRMIRELRNYDQQYVASRLFIGRSTLSTWEKGITPVKTESLKKLAEVFNLQSYRQIIDFDPDRLLQTKIY
jgi:transcriptional regulator with XRE-family HTH domain